MPMRLSAIAAIIRKDLQLLWPLALAIFVLQLGTTLFLHEVTEFPGARLPTDREFLNVRNPIFWVGAGLPPILAAIFIVIGVQGDAISDRRNDWLTRPIGALEIALAKIALVLGVVFLPFALGTIIFTVAMQADPALTMLPVAIMLRNCLFGILLAWLVSSLLQATIALVGMMTITAVLMAIGTAILVAIRAHAGIAPDIEVPDETALTAWPRILIQTAVQAAMMWPVLWLLLAQRKIGAARLVFVAAYVIVSGIPFSYLRRPPNSEAHAPPVIHFTPALETRYA